MNGNKEYDLIVSLGGNCMVANNLRYRNMRPFSLPFDWVYMQDDKPIKFLIKNFSNRFENLLLRENIKKIEGNNDHKIIYYDKYSGYFFPNHFKCDTLSESEYNKVYKTLRRRIDRLFNFLEKSSSVLFVLASEISFSEEDILMLKQALTNLYPNKQLNFRIMIFNSTNDEEKTLDNSVCIYRYKRTQNLYDFTKTNYEWHFLDNIKLSNINYSTNKTSIKLFSFKLKNNRYRLEFSWKNI